MAVQNTNPNPITPYNAPVFLSDVNSGYTLNYLNIIVTNKNAINNEIDNLFNTPKGSEWFEPEYGTDIEDEVFQNINDTTAWGIETDTYRAMDIWIVHVQLIYNQCAVIPYSDEDFYDAQITYAIKYNNLVASYSSTFSQ